MLFHLTFLEFVQYVRIILIIVVINWLSVQHFSFFNEAQAHSSLPIFFFWNQFPIMHFVTSILPNVLSFNFIKSLVYHQIFESDDFWQNFSQSVIRHFIFVLSFSGSNCLKLHYYLDVSFSQVICNSKQTYDVLPTYYLLIYFAKSTQVFSQISSVYYEIHHSSCNY